MGKKSTSKFSDTRLDKVFSGLVASMVTRFTATIRQLGQGTSEEMRYGRFINNAKVNPDVLLEHYWKEIKTDFKDKHILVINDTSTVGFAHRSDREGLGYVGPKTTKSGFDLHPSLMVDATNSHLYGIGGITIQKTEFIKTEEDKALQLQNRKDNWKIPFEDKERYKWFTSPQKAINNCAGAAKYTLIGDRESDIYDLIARTLQNNWEFVYRSKTNRRIEPQLSAKTLYKVIDNWQIADTYELNLPATKKRSAHLATMELKFGTVNIERPKSHPDKDLPASIKLQVVEVKEQPQTVVGDEKAVHWLILTSHPTDTIEQARQIIQWYQWRWIIEELFRTLKTKGIDIEKSEVETYNALTNLSTLALIAASQVMQLVRARDGQSEQKMEDSFFEAEQECLLRLNNKLEGRTQKLKNPYPADSLAFATWVIARLGGWSGYQSKRPAGPITIINGLARFHNIMEGFYLRL